MLVISEVLAACHWFSKSPTEWTKKF